MGLSFLLLVCLLGPVQWENKISLTGYHNRAIHPTQEDGYVQRNPVVDDDDNNNNK